MDELPPLEASDEVTQYGLVKATGPDFKIAPVADQRSLSLIHGRVDPDGAARLVMNRAGRRRDAVRFSTIGKLQEAGFVVVRAPLDWFREHLEVYGEGNWDDNDSERFNDCFRQPEIWTR